MIEPARLAGGTVLRSQADARLVDLVRAGNDRAFEAIVARYRRSLLRYCGRILTPARAEDAVQQTFLNAYKAMKADERAIDLRPWLYRVAHNASLNVLRAAGPGTEEIDEQIDGVERPEQALERRERLGDLVAAVQALPPRQRDAIILHELEGRSYEQIASELNVSGGAVRQLLNRARTTLRAGATALVPEGLIIRMATSDGEPVAVRIGELVAAGGGGAAIVKTGTAVVLAGAVAAGATGGPLGSDAAERDRAARGSAASNAASAAAEPGGPGGASVPATTGGETGNHRAKRRGDRRRAGTAARGQRRGRGRGRGGDSPTSAPIRRDDDGRSDTGIEDDDRSGSDDDRSGPGGGEPDGDRSGPGDGSLTQDDNSGPGSGSDGGGSNSGPGSGDDPVPLAMPDDNSGPGGGGDSSGSGSSGSGSSGSGSSGSGSLDDPER